MSLKIIEKSPYVSVKETKSLDPINLFTQFYIPENLQRLYELQTTLKYNVNNAHINKIYLFNERIYRDTELGINSNKIRQINIGKRLKFSDFFNYTQNNNIKGFNILINADIFFDETLYNLNKSDIDISKKMFALLRYEYRDEQDLSTCCLFGSTEYFQRTNKKENCPIIEGHPASNDTWIIHSNNRLTDKEIKLFNFELGMQGCDNKIIYLFKILGYEIYNDVDFIRTYHNQKQHTTQRNYSNKNTILPPWGIYFPSCVDLKKVNLKILDVDLKAYINDTNELSFHNFTQDNIELYKYITDKFSNNENFVIPRIAGIENVLAYLGVGLNNKDIKWDYLKYQTGLKMVKTSAGIKLTNDTSIIKYSKCYCSAFEYSDLITSWEINGSVRKAIHKSHDFIRHTFQKRELGGYVYDIFHHINNPWTHALRGKRILIISPFVESIKEKIPVLNEIYGKDLFPGCSFILLKPPQTQGDEPSQEFDIEFNSFCGQINMIKDEFDVALCSCGGYGNPICAFIYKHLNKSAIYVGGVLQMYFGIYGNRWLKERKDIMQLYLNKHWSRPKLSEKPKSADKIEDNCYW